MEYVYLLVHDDGEWEDLIIFLSEEEAIKNSIKHPHQRVEIFGVNSDGGYTPTYNYYKNGEKK